LTMEEFVIKRKKINLKKIKCIDQYLKINQKGIIDIIKNYSIPEIELIKFENFFSIQEKMFGIQHGIKYTNNNKQSYMSIYKNDKLNGPYKHYYCNGSNHFLGKIEQYENNKILYTKIYYPVDHNVNNDSLNSKNHSLNSKNHSLNSKNKSQIKGKLKEKYSFDQDKLLHGKHYEYNNQTNEHILTIYEHGISINTNIWFT